MPEGETYEVYAVRYAAVEERQRHENFIAADPHEGVMPIHFFVWALVNRHRTIVVDTGFDAPEAARRGRSLIRPPREGLALLGIDTHQVTDVIITHLHWDHAGTLADFPNARFHVQDKEMAYTSGRHMLHRPFAHAYTADHVCDLIRCLFEGRLVFHDGDEEVFPGVSVHLIGGHTMGLQCVRVHTTRGWVVLASDASHFYENMERTAPFPIVYNLGDMVLGYDKMRRLADSAQHIVPGHDPLVLERYRAPDAQAEGIAVRLDMPPTA